MSGVIDAAIIIPVANVVVIRVASGHFLGSLDVSGCVSGLAGVHCERPLRAAV